MNGPEHYREAERLLANVARQPLSAEEVSAEAALAQVHATLALTAATALGATFDQRDQADMAMANLWADVT